MPGNVSSIYTSWPTIADLSAVTGYQGLSEDRRKALFDPNKENLKTRMQHYLDASLSWEAYKTSQNAVLIDDYVDFSAETIRAKALLAIKYDESMVHPYAVRPFDNQYCYWSELRPLWRRHRPDFAVQVKAKQHFLVTRAKGGNRDEGAPLAFISGFCDYHYVPPNASSFPLGLVQRKDGADQHDWFAAVTANLSPNARTYLAALNLPNPDAHPETAELIWMHALAIGYSPAYLSDNADGIRENWPRIPLPATGEALLASAALGRQVAALLDTETPVLGVTSGTLRPELKTIAVVCRVGGGALKPQEFALTAGWGSGGNGKPVMPGVGRVERNAAGVPTPSLDVYLNASAYWQNVPQPVWDFTIGGYQVMKKWLSYREQRVLSRALTMAEIMEVTAMARRLAALVLLRPRLDENYTVAATATFDWAKSENAA